MRDERSIERARARASAILRETYSALQPADVDRVFDALDIYMRAQFRPRPFRSRLVKRGGGAHVTHDCCPGFGDLKARNDVLEVENEELLDISKRRREVLEKLEALFERWKPLDALDPVLVTMERVNRGVGEARSILKEYRDGEQRILVQKIRTPLERSR